MTLTRGKIWLLIGVGALAAFLLAAAVLYGVAVWRTRAAIAAELDRIRTAGEPVTVADVAARFERRMASAEPRCPCVAVVASLKPDLGESGPDGDDAAELLAWSRRTVGRHGGELAELNRAGERGTDCRFETSSGPPVLGSVRSISAVFQLLEAAVRVAVADRDGAAAGKALRTKMWLQQQAGHLDDRAVCFHIRAAVFAIALRSAETCLPLLPEPDLAHLAKQLDEIDVRDHLERCLLGDRAETLASFDQYEELHAMKMTGPLAKARTEAAYLREMAACLQIADQPWAEARRSANALRGAEENHGWQARLDEFIGPDRSFLSTIWFSLETLTMRAQRFQSQRDTARLAVAAERYRRSHGSYPADPAALVPEFLPAVPADPFANGVLKYRAEGGSLLVYSVGANGTDDGGENDGFQTTDDIAFRVGAAAAGEGEPAGGSRTRSP